MAACFGGVVFSSSIQCFISLFQMAQNVNLRRTAVFLSVSFLAGWGCFPIVRGSRVEHAKGLCCAIPARLPARTASYIYVYILQAFVLGHSGLKVIANAQQWC